MLATQVSEPSVDDLLAAFDDEQWELDPAGLPADGAAPVPAQQLHPVRLLGVPSTLWLAARQHHDAMLRELALYLACHDDVTVDLAGAELARQTFSNAVGAAIEEAQRSQSEPQPPPARHPGRLRDVLAPVDPELHLPPESGPAASALQDALDTAERLADEGRLLAFPGQPEVVAVRDWLCEQVQSQLHGIPPRPWPGTAHQRFETAVHRQGGEWGGGLVEALDVVRHSQRGVVAADEGNRILAVSEHLAAALGWQVEDLLGRRVVVLIPPALREAHVAGFSRHLSTGEVHVLGVPLTLPVLRADGREILCDFMVEQAASWAGRSLYLAWITPVDAAGPVGATPGDAVT